MKKIENAGGHKPVGPDYCQPAVLFQGLVDLENGAIRFLHGKVSRFLKRKNLVAAISAMDLEEVANDAVVFTIQKIGNGGFQFQGVSPASYATSVAEKILLNRSRKNQRRSFDGLPSELAVEAEIETYFEQKAMELAVGEALSKLSENAQLLIRLRYFENLSDKEIVEQGLTPYSNTDSLKSKRCKVLRQLGELLQPQDLNTL